MLDKPLQLEVHKKYVVGMPNDGHKQCSTDVLVHERLAKFEARNQVLMLPLMMLVLMTKPEAVRRHC